MKQGYDDIQPSEIYKTQLDLYLTLLCQTLFFIPLTLKTSKSPVIMQVIPFLYTFF